jgi:hypothetical protein
MRLMALSSCGRIAIDKHIPIPAAASWKGTEGIDGGNPTQRRKVCLHRWRSR